MVVCVAFLIGMRGWLRVLFETLDKRGSHSCACTRSVMAIVCACFGSVLKERASSEFCLNEMSCKISARMLVWKLRRI